MAEAIILQIIDGVTAALNTDRPFDVPEVTNRRVVPGEKIREERMAVFLGDEEVDPWRARGDSLARRRVQIAVQCSAPVEDPADLDASVQPMLNWSAAVLGQLRPPVALRGLVHYFRETSTLKRPEQMDVFVMSAIVFYECSYQTRRDDLTAPS